MDIITRTFRAFAGSCERSAALPKVSATRNTADTRRGGNTDITTKFNMLP